MQPISHQHAWVLIAAFCLAPACFPAGCSAAGGGDDPATGSGGAGGSNAAGSAGEADASIDVVGSGGSGGAEIMPDPTDCVQAATGHTYLGCDFWPTVTDNIVAPGFDFAVVVANPGSDEANIKVTRNGADVATAVVPGNGLTKIFLPWVQELKGLQPANGCPTSVKTSTVRAPGGAYHLTSSRPVAAYQFNAIEYAAKGGPEGKDWDAYCSSHTCFGMLAGKCFSYTNDASLLLPSTALTGNYRIAGGPPWTDVDDTDPVNPTEFTFPAYFAVTGTQDNTSVTVNVSATGGIAAGGGVPATPAGGQATFNVNAGEVVLVVGTKTADFSGSLVKASAPIQIITGIACTQMPHGTEACDHLEETVQPVETLGKHYFVTVPTGPYGAPDSHIVRIYGNVDGTQITYPAGNPGFPTEIGAGQMFEAGPITQDLEIDADHEFVVSTFQHGQGPTSSASRGDPAQSFATTVEQYRVKYIFLAPDDYDVSFADIVQPMDATLTLDGEPLPVAPVLISSNFGVARVQLGPGIDGAHVLESDKPVGLQVLGYGDYTSYQYPGGLNLGFIAPVPPK